MLWPQISHQKFRVDLKGNSLTIQPPLCHNHGDKILMAHARVSVSKK